MKILLSWLNEFAPFGDDAPFLADALSSLGLEVGTVVQVDVPVPGVVTARVLRVETHPDAAKVRRVWVDAGDGVERHVWCGASNMSAGDLVPLATLGTTMPDGRTISARGILGIESQGMLCSAVELGLGADAGGIMLLDPSGTAGQPLHDALGIRADWVFDVDVTRNRPDALGHYGVARDLAAWLGLELAPLPEPVFGGDPRPLPVSVEDPAGCPRFTVAVVTGVRVAPSPDWMARRLRHVGMRSINNIVDASNLVNLELNQPNHAYDLAAVADGFAVRRARAGESMVTLDGERRGLDPDDLLICDGSGRPVGLAGVIGGLDSEVTSTTTSVALEMAWFEPLGIARTAARHGLRTEASLRFERGVDPQGMPRATAAFARYLSATCPDLVVHGPVTDVSSAALPAPVRTVSVRPSRVQRVLGVPCDRSVLAARLEPIGFAVGAEGADGSVPVSVPSWRPDCGGEIDVVEEVARHLGYGSLGSRRPRSPQHGGLTAVQQRRRRVRDVMVALGASEAMPNPFLAPGELEAAGLGSGSALRLANPLVAEESVVRTSLRPGLLKAVAYNQSHRNDRIALFEVGHAYPQGSGHLPDEYECLAVAIAGAEAPAAVHAWSQVAAVLGTPLQIDQSVPCPGLHAGRSGALARGRQVLGVVGEIDPGVLAAYGIDGRVAWLEVNLTVLLAEEPRPARAQSVSRYPSTDFDLSFLAPDAVASSAIVRAIKSAAGQWCISVALFDVYRDGGAAGRGLAYRIRLQAPDRTLTDAEVAEVRSRCVAAAAKAGAVLRG
ncbi:MAG: phenylalanine--tRNA ligase subunit beta [Acidobacteria bacterium]|nr:phenylalanine--tRNA ligase subunit beta [Acidobacteriota bacterium]